MNEKEAPIERYTSICKEYEDMEKRKNQVNDALLKDELIKVAERNGLDVNKSLTKDQIAEKLVRPGFYKQIVQEKGEQEPEEEREELERPEPEPPEIDILSPLQEMLSGSAITDPTKINELWTEGIKRIEDNLDDINEKQIGYWKNIEEEWTKRTLDFQEQIEELRESSELPAKETKNLAVIWRNFYNKMSAKMTKFSEQTRKRQEALNEITEKYRERATFTEGSDVRDIGKVFALWSDFSEDMRKEMEEAIEDYDIDYGDYTETWEKFSSKTEDILQDLQENQTTQAEDLFEQWNSDFKQMKNYIDEGYSKFESIYNIFWDQIEEQNGSMTELATEISEEVGENYSNILESYVETVNKGYQNLFNMPGLSAHRSRQEKKVEDLKKRVKELEEQIEED